MKILTSGAERFIERVVKTLDWPEQAKPRCRNRRQGSSEGQPSSARCSGGNRDGLTRGTLSGVMPCRATQRGCGKMR